MSVKSASVEDEYRKNEKLKKEDILALKEWMEKQSHLPNISELELILFQHSCYNRNEFAKVTIDNFYTMRAHTSEFFRNRNPKVPPAENIFIFNMAPLPIKTKENYTVFLASLKDFNPEKFNISILFKAIDMNAMLHLEEDGTSVGHVLLADLTGASLGHLARINLLHVKKFLYYVQEALPIRLKGIHFINIVPFMDKILALIKPFLKKELWDVLYVHQTLEDAYKYIPKECFPNDCGGKAGMKDDIFESQKKRVLANADWFVHEESVMADESRRVEKGKDLDKIFGVEGTFKKLDID